MPHSPVLPISHYWIPTLATDWWRCFQRATGLWPMLAGLEQSEARPIGDGLRPVMPGVACTIGVGRDGA